MEWVIEAKTTDDSHAFKIARIRNVEPFIRLTAAEVQSGLDRVRWAEGLIRQLPENHDGRNSWLLNYGSKAADLSFSRGADRGADRNVEPVEVPKRVQEAHYKPGARQAIPLHDEPRDDRGDAMDYARLSLRQHYIGCALTGILADMKGHALWGEYGGADIHKVARAAMSVADAVIELERKSK